MKKQLNNNFKYLVLIALIILWFSSNSFIQGQTQTDFLVGTFIASSPNTDSTLFYNYEQILDCGFNSVFQYAKKSQPSNLTQLYQFNYVYAANDSAPQHSQPDNEDWISYFTHAKYFRWEAEGDDNFPIIQSSLDDSTVGVRHQFGELDEDGWSSGTNSDYLNQFLVLGPKYTQYMKYVYTNRSYTGNPLIQYNAVFSLKLGSPQTSSFDVAEIMVTVYDTKTKLESAPLASWILTSDTLSTEFQLFTLTYNYGDFYLDNSGNNGSTLPPPSALNWVPLQENSSTPWIDFDKKVQFKIKWLTNVELIIDYVEVYDEEIWKNYIYTVDGYQDMVTNISTYNQAYSTLGSKLKYFYTIDEPHTWDSFIPIKKVQHILDSLNTGRKLLVHFYPGWNNRREQLSVINRWVNIATPSKLMFWYTPFTCDDKVTPCDPYDRNFTLYFLRQNLQNAHTSQQDFFIALQTFGVKEKDFPIYHIYNTPTPVEVSAETMLSLAHGCKGIYFEEYYSRESWSWNLNRTVDVENLVDRFDGEQYPPRDTWYKCQYLAGRLRDVLGKTLMQLNYSATNEDNGFLRLATYIDSRLPQTSPIETMDYLTLSTTTQNPTPAPYNFHAGFFDRAGQSDNNYFLLTNLLTTESKWVSVTVANNFSNCTNIRFRNIETNYNFDMTFSGQTTQSFNFPAGEGYLFQVAPVVKYGGKLVYNETVLGGTTLTDDMSIESGATLYVIGNYHANANITVKNGGKIICSGNGKITFSSGKKLVLEGTAQLLGNSSTDKLKLEFSSVVNGIEIQPNSSVTINNCEITGAYTGIASIAGSPSVVNISNSKISAAYSCISLTGTGSELNSTPTIENCELTSTISGISVANYSEFLVLNNKLNNCGIYFSNVPASYIQGNKINGGANQSILGVFMNNCGGFIRKDTITNCLNAIQLANSSPDIGGCWIYNNKRHGIYIGSGSIPNLVGYYTTNPPTYFALSGYNKIDANGLQTSSTPVDNDGSEIYLSTANILLNNGCNQISDDRLSTPSMNTQYLISGSLPSGGGRSLNAIYNYWGTRIPASNRYKNLSVIFSPYYTTACTLGGGSSSEFLVLKTSTGAFVDSISSAEGEPENFTTLEASYSEADNLFATGNITQSKPMYEEIVNGNYTSEEKLSAYNKLYAIGNLTGADENYFTGLQNTFEDIANNEADTLIKKVYEQNAIKCDVSKQEYLTAINKFDNIIQQNPNSEEAVYAEIDILTTALNIDTTNPGLGKIGGGKYLVKGTSDYLSKLNDILQSKFGVNTEDQEQIIPKEYSLHQNYPNPFNPATTIKYDLPNDGLVQLEVFDILGRRITTLVNDYKSAGSYEHQFDASQLASGVYIYKIQAGDFISSKKMILLK